MQLREGWNARFKLHSIKRPQSQQLFHHFFHVIINTFPPIYLTVLFNPSFHRCSNACEIGAGEGGGAALSPLTKAKNIAVAVASRQLDLPPKTAGHFKLASLLPQVPISHLADLSPCVSHSHPPFNLGLEIGMPYPRRDSSFSRDPFTLLTSSKTFTIAATESLSPE